MIFGYLFCLFGGISIGIMICFIAKLTFDYYLEDKNGK